MKLLGVGKRSMSNIRRFLFLKNVPVRLIQTILMFCVLQLIYWSVFIPLNKPSPVPLDTVISDFEFAQINEPTIEAAKNASYTKIKATWEKDIEAPYYVAIKAQFEISKDITDDLGMGFTYAVDNQHIFINGIPVVNYGRLKYPATYHSQKREIVKVSIGILKPGTNDILVIGAKNKLPGILVGHTILGDYQGIMKATSRKRFLFTDFRKLTIVISALVALLSLLMLPQTQNKSSALWLTLLSGSICARTLFFFNYGTFGGELARVIIYFSVTNLIALSWFNYLGAWSDGSKKIRKISTLIYLGLIALVTILTLNNFTSGFQASGQLTNWFTLICTLAAMIRLGWLIFWRQEKRVWEAATLALGVSLTLWDTVGFIFQNTDFGHQRIMAPIVLFSLVAASLSRNLRIYDSMGAFNVQLENTLAEREKEIKQNLKDVETVKRQRDVANERQRILRDMHDGIGAQLVLLLSAARTGDLDAKALESALSQTLVDLRLMIDSLDSVSTDFAVALGTFRTRMMSTLTAGGYTLHWDLEKLPIGVNIQPRIVLNVYKILQEAIANILKHANATEISISVCPNNVKTSPGYDIKISDNGKGLKSESNPGQGMKSMRRRAENIGADISFESTKEGLFIYIRNIKTG